jgi:hypothetical protein
MNEAAQEPPQHESGLGQLLAAGIKYSVLLGFGLYALGFIIWYAFLGRFGLYPRSIQTFEFFAAALCYLGFVGTLAVPPVLLLLLMNRKPTGGTTSILTRMEPLLAVWYAILYASKGMYFRGGRSGWFSWLPIGALVSAFVFGAWLRASKKPGRFIRFFGHGMTRWTLTTLAMLLWIALSSGDSAGFIIVTIFLLGVVGSGGGGIGGPDISEVWKTRIFEVRVMICFFAALVVIAHARGFGSKQFGRIPKEFGGGQPEMGFIALVKPAVLTTNSPV